MKKTCFPIRKKNKLVDMSRRLLRKVMISLLLGHKLKKCGIFAFNELAQLDGFDRVKNSFVYFGKWLSLINKLNMLQ